MKLAIVLSHPTQYYSPWFRFIARNTDIQIRVFYLWDFGVTTKRDVHFRRDLEWDIPLLDGYEHEFVPNISKHPGTNSFDGLWNPTLPEKLLKWKPHAILLFGYNFRTHRTVMKSSKLRTVPMLFRGDSHVLAAKRNAAFVLKTLRRAIIFHRFDGFLAVGKANEDYFRTARVPDRKIFFAPHCVDNNRFAAAFDAAADAAQNIRQGLGIRAGELMLLFAGKLEPKKRPDLLLDAFLNLRDSRAHLVLAGSGELESTLKQKAAGSDRIHFPGFFNQTQIPSLYRACDLFILPSQGEYETWGLAVNEAMCLKRAVIVSNHVGCARDLVRDRSNGLIFEAGNVRELTRALGTALLDTNLLREWGEAGSQIVAKYSYAAATDGLLRAMSSLGLRSSV